MTEDLWSVGTFSFYQKMTRSMYVEMKMYPGSPPVMIWIKLCDLLYLHSEMWYARLIVKKGRTRGSAKSDENIGTHFWESDVILVDHPRWGVGILTRSSYSPSSSDKELIANQ